MSSPSASTLALAEAFKNRRSTHTLSDDITLPDARIQEIIHDAVKHSPSPFNYQGSRVVLLVKAEHHKFWDIARKVAQTKMPAQVFKERYEARIDMFRAAYGTVLFFAAGSRLKDLQTQYPLIGDLLPQWEEHMSGMLQYAVWNMLTSEGLGCNLQHYNPMVNTRVAEEWKLPADWSLKAQMVFGKPVGELREKTFEPVEGTRFFVHGV
ncbi:Nitroreductase-like protein [Lasiosphaeria ovina]|uniref:Nitroreductase-like protein n=1 Tax=Lasiosphaeria ovina TaxID=92902 RepID=A0AAE0N4R0_9PEZI|nr:Nitroreductase-like protein [Lasiosphaeria ovina]